MSSLSPDARDRLYAELAGAVTTAGEARESLFFARLSLLLFEAVGDEQACRAALRDASTDLPTPSLSCPSAALAAAARADAR